MSDLGHASLRTFGNAATREKSTRRVTRCRTSIVYARLFVTVILSFKDVITLRLGMDVSLRLALWWLLPQSRVAQVWDILAEVKFDPIPLNHSVRNTETRSKSGHGSHVTRSVQMS